LQTFDRTDLVAFLRAVDARLSGPGAIRLIGGAVISLAHVPSYQTRDVDYAWADREVDVVVGDLGASRPDLVRGAQTGVYFAPYSYQDRVEILEVPGLVNLRVEIPERHDLAIMKITRGYERDLAVLESMHAAEPFELPVLVERYEETWVTGPRRTADLGFGAALDLLFGDEEAEAGMKMLAALRAEVSRSGPRKG
jgi:hypothetical protein